MTSLSSAGAGYRTKPMLPAQAERFARCLRANTAFRSVSVADSRSPGKRVVVYQPASDVRQSELLALHQDAREQRAASQGFTFLLDTDTEQPFCHCHSHTSGEVYETTLFDCSCPDFQFRCRGALLRCKHMLALSAAIDSGEVRRWDEPQYEVETW